MRDEAGRTSPLGILTVLRRIWGFVLGAVGQPGGCFYFVLFCINQKSDLLPFECSKNPLAPWLAP